ncbi:E3 ubiquitin-protein ligase RNF133 [Carex littledalei]|uniref:E3 ubiquitin-protein ligase RNF133 n=1 Tax=Carex littledalei TaxID=544730 RepID=A0A833QRB2_9POAL|nr:E3 ubiquitin-protein ligase RNF133 [Carex littledalei]
MSSYRSRFDGQSDNGAEYDHSQNWITRVPRPLHQRMGEETELHPWRLFEERVRTGPFGLSRFPLQPFSPVRILVLSGGSGNINNRSNNNDGINPRLQRFIQNSPPRIRNEWNVWTAMEHFEPEDPGLTENEFKAAMKRLKKQVYEAPKRAQRRGLFGGTRSTKNEVEVERTGEGGGRECTICLESFVPNEHVLVTPCKHMFHGDCIAPWVKSHGKCPICRLAFCERTESGGVPLNYNNNNNSNGNNSNTRVLSAGEAAVGEEEELALQLLALVRAMEEAFNWVTLNSRAISFD